MPVQCQVCGRRQGTRADGTIRLHHRGGLACVGSGHVPHGEGTDALELALSTAQARSRAVDVAVARHRAERRNEPLDADFWRDAAKVSAEVCRLRTRLDRPRKAAERERRKVARERAASDRLWKLSARRWRETHPDDAQGEKVATSSS